MRFRLRYLHYDLELTDGEFAVGRSASCQLALDDPLVSRRHALLVVSETAVAIEDLDSRNGVLVNGKRIQGRVFLAINDRILIGAQELVLLHGTDTASLVSTSKLTPATITRLPLSEGDPLSPAPGRAHPVSTASPPPGHGAEEDPNASVARRAGAFTLLASVANKALALGRAEEAERILATTLVDVIDASRAGRLLSAPMVDRAAHLAAKLASATSKGAWADYVVELYATQGRPCPALVIDELYGAFRKVDTFDLTALRGYLTQLRTKMRSFGPAERFLFQRLEGLERLASRR